MKQASWLITGSRFGVSRAGVCSLALASLLSGCADPLGEPLDDASATVRSLPVVGPVLGQVFDEVDSELAPPAPLGAPYPIILVHGFSGWTDVGDVAYFFRVVDDLTAAGADVTAPALPPYDNSLDRAQVLSHVVDSVLARTNKRKVHLIAHSQGGIDSRVLITDLGYADRVASLTTISTPHRGTAVADLADYASDGVLNPAGALMGWLLGTLEGAPPDEETWRDDEGVEAAYDPDLVAAIDGMRPATMETFNAAHPDPLGVPVFSLAGVSNLLSLEHPLCADGLWPAGDTVDAVDPFFAASGLLLSLSDGGDVFDPTPNDGLVAVSSARWGVFLGCVPADHADEIGQIASDGPSAISEWDHRQFYLRLLQHVRDVEAHEP